MGGGVRFGIGGAGTDAKQRAALNDLARIVGGSSAQARS
jgi:hypothetical protein